MSIWEKENALFEEWIQHEKEWTGFSEEFLNGHFCWDGLHFTGMPSEPHYEADGHSWRVMDGDDKQDEIWAKAFIKPVFLCKDHNGNEAVDEREETGYSNERFYHSFYGKFLMLLYALTNYDSLNQSFLTLEEAWNIDNCWLGEKGYFHAPVVRMNLKKIAGGPKCYDNVLSEYIRNDLAFITRQKDIYDGANVFVCCHGGEPSNPIMDLLQNEWFPNLKRYRDSGFIWYDDVKKIIVLHEWHMSVPYVSYEDYYSAIGELEGFLKEQPGFLG